MERFYHIRAHQGGSFYYPVLSHGGATVHLSEAGRHDEMHVLARVAHCNISDVYSKKLGREHCVGRRENLLTVPARDAVGTIIRDGGGFPVFENQVVPALPAADPVELHLREIPGFFAKLYHNVQKRAGFKRGAYEAPNFESRIREWLPRG